MNQIHHTAIVYQNVILGQDIYIGPYCIIGSNPEWKGREQDNKTAYNSGNFIGNI